MNKFYKRERVIDREGEKIGLRIASKVSSIEGGKKEIDVTLYVFSFQV